MQARRLTTSDAGSLYLVEEGEDGAPRLVRLRRHSSELARAAAPLLVDVTGFAFAGTACFEDEYLRDPENYYFQSDRLTEYDIFGNYGMAIGDVNDDGYEDVYTCTAAGMPNRLFLRNPDGTVREASEEWNVGFLDTTRSAVIADLDGDGHRDLAVALGSRVVVAWNDGTRFGERTVLSSGGADDVYGISVADPDGDGDVDLYACCYGVGVVREGSRGPARVLSNVPTPYYDATNGASNVYWRNDGPRRFTDATAESGLMQNNDKFSFSSIWEDLDGDGDLDLYVANDFGRNHLYRNEGGHFVDVAGPGGADDRANGMGPSCADFDLDGDIDINVSNIHAPEGMRITDLAVMRGSHGRGDALLHSQPLARGNTLLRNRGDGTFENVADAYGVNRCGWAWGARFLDLDNDMYEDLYSPNGWFTRQGTEDVNEFFWRFVIAQSPPEGKPTPTYSIAMTTIEHIALEQGHTWAGGEYSVMLMNQGGERFVDTTALVAPHRPTDGRAVAGLDWDRDGCIDLVLKNRDAPRVQLLHNRNPEAVAGNWLVVELRNEAPNRDAIGARIELHAGGKVQRRTIYAGDGFISQTPRRQHFGLEGLAPEALVVRWPDGTVERHPGGEAPGAGLEANRAYVIERGAEAPVELPWEPLEGFHELPHEPLDKLEDRLRRVVLFDELPMGPFPLPSFDDGARTVSDFSGAPLLVTLWSQAGEACEGQLMRLARERERLEAAGVRAVPITIDEGPELAAARRTAQQLGFAETGGYADGRLMLAFEVVLGDVLPRTGNIAMPCNLLFDARGELCVIYQGPVRVDVVLEDLAALGRRGERSAGEALSGGLWIDPPSRAFATLAKTMDELGRSELSRFYAECAEAR